MFARSAIFALFALGVVSVGFDSTFAQGTSERPSLSEAPIVLAASAAKRRQCEAEFKQCRANRPRGASDRANYDRCLSRKYNCLD